MKVCLTWGLALALGGLPACTRHENPSAGSRVDAGPTRSGNLVHFEPSSPQLDRVRVTDVTPIVLPVDEFEAPGKVEALPTSMARLALPVSGRVRNVLVTLGDRVVAGQTLLTVDTPDSSTLLAAWQQAGADVTHRRTALAKAEADTSRVRDLLANRAIAEKELMAAQAAQSEAEAALAQARATEDDVQRRLKLLGIDPRKQGPVTLRSPEPGEVVEISVAPGEYRSDTAAPVITIADLARVWVVAAVPESGLGQVQSGQPVIITLAAYPGQQFEGRVTRIAASLDPDTRTGKVIAQLENPQRLLRPEMFARVRYTGPARPVVTVPIGAIVRDEGRTTVFVERERGQFERREVSIGPRHNDAVVITNGLNRGDRVVFDGTMLLMGQ